MVWEITANSRKYLSIKYLFLQFNWGQLGQLRLPFSIFCNTRSFKKKKKKSYVIKAEIRESLHIQ